MENAQYKAGTLRPSVQKSSQLPRNSLLLCLSYSECQASTSPQSKRPEKVADAPFDDPEPDLILLLVSSDEVYFYVVKKILTLASSILADKFSTLPPPHYDVLPVAFLPEPSTTLDLALRHIYTMRTSKTDMLQMRVPSLNCAKLQSGSLGYRGLSRGQRRERPCGRFLPSPLHTDTRALGQKPLDYV